MRSKYLFATGVLRVRETKLLKLGDIERMIDAPSIEVAYKVFNDLDYADELADVKSPQEFNEVLDHDLRQVKELFRAIIPDKELLDILFLGYDFHNIKLFFEAKYTEKDLDDFVSHLGDIDIGALRKFIIKDEEVVLPEDVEEIVRQAKQVYEKDFDPHQLDAFLDKKYFELLEKKASHFGNKFICDLIATKISIANVKIFLRAKKMGKPLEEVQADFIDGGTILRTDLIKVYGEELKTGIEVCKRGFDDVKLKEELDKYLDHRKLWRLEKAFENHEIRFCRKAKYIAYGPEIAVAYYWAKENAMRNIRLVMMAKLNGIPAEEIKERVREIY